MRTVTVLCLFASVSFLACPGASAEEAAAPAKIRVAVLTGGHGYDEEPFVKLFEGHDGIECTQVRLKDHSEIFEDVADFPYDVLVFYNMTQQISDKRRENFLKLMDQGVGVVALHHCIAAYTGWPEFRKIIGGIFLLEDTEENGVVVKKSGYQHGLDVEVKVADKQHPITEGMSDFTIHDETYNKQLFEPDNHVLLTTDNPASDKPLAWVREYRKARVFYMQMGHGPHAFVDANYRLLVSRGIRWVAAK